MPCPASPGSKGSSWRDRMRGRRLLLWMGLVFCGTQLLAGLIFDYCWEAVRLPFLWRQRQQLAAQPESPTVIFLGSSRFGTCLDQETLHQAFRQRCGRELGRLHDGSVPCGDSVTFDCILEVLLRHGIRPRLAVIEVCPEQLSRHSDWLTIHIERHLRWDNLFDYLEDIARTGKWNEALLERLTPLWTHRRRIQDELGELGRSFLGRMGVQIGHLPPRDSSSNAPSVQTAYWNKALGISGPQTAAQIQANKEEGLVRVRQAMRNYQTGGRCGAALERLLRRCREHGIEVILVAPPVGSEQRYLYTAHVEASFGGWIQCAMDRYHCRYWDGRASVADELFRDNHHCKPEGAVVFSRQLADEILAAVFQPN